MNGKSNIEKLFRLTGKAITAAKFVVAGGGIGAFVGACIALDVGEYFTSTVLAGTAVGGALGAIYVSKMRQELGLT